MIKIRAYFQGLALTLCLLVGFWVATSGGKTLAWPVIEVIEFLALSVTMLGWMALALRQVMSGPTKNGYHTMIPIFFASIAAIGIELEFAMWVESARYQAISVVAAVALLILWIVLIRAWWREGARRWDILAALTSAPIFGYVLLTLILIVPSYFLFSEDYSGVVFFLREAMEIIAFYSFLFAMVVAHRIWFS